MSGVEEARERFETALADLRGSFGRELGGRPRKARGWGLPLVAFAAGLGLALALGRRRRAGREATKTET